ncbi:MAG: hypothetical protein ACJAZN_001922 [Planctomycetota bacterium]|jgi:hypothetical protein
MTLLPTLRRSAVALGCAALALASTSIVLAATPTGQKAEWTAEIEAALERAAVERRVVMLALGEVGEGRSDLHLKEVYRSKTVAPYLEQFVNVAAWSFDPEERDDAPDIGGMVPGHHIGNREAIKGRWVSPNESGVIALPQHLWLSPDGELLLSCPWEIDADEFAWCSDEALRRAEVEERPELGDDARPPRRLLLGETFRVLDEDKLGRGLKPQELEDVLKKLKKRFMTMGDRAEVTQILFTDDDDAVDFMEKQLGLWDMGGAGTGGVVDLTVGLVGLVSPASYLPVLEAQAGDNRESRRQQVAIAYENIGSPDGLKAIKRAWKKEKDEATRADWARAMGASGRGEKSVAKVLIRASQKEKSARVRHSSMIGLGHVVPEPSALEFLLDTAEKGGGFEREAAILALGLGRVRDARPMLAKIKEQDLADTTKAAVDAALAVLDGGNLALLEPEVKRVSMSEGTRGRLFFRAITPRPTEGR